MADQPEVSIPANALIEETPIPPTIVKKNSIATPVNHLILSKFAATTFAAVLDSHLPQLIIGRVGGMVSDLRSPYQSILCALYRIDIEVQSRDDPTVWEQKYTEVKSADFVLMDPQNPKEKLYICGNEYVIELISDLHSHTSDNFHKIEAADLSPQLRVLFHKAGISETSKARVREEIYEVNAQLAVFGVVEVGHPVYGKKARRMVPVIDLFQIDVNFLRLPSN